jgi:hypothetical protein
VIEQAKQPCLRVVTEIGHFVDEEGAAVRLIAEARSLRPAVAEEERDGGFARVPVQSNATNGFARRGPTSWSASASSSFPVPVSPSMITGKSLWAIRSQSG